MYHIDHSKPKHIGNRAFSHEGFTIVELLIVIVVIAILAAISVVAYNGIQTRAKDNKRAQDVAVIEKAIKGYDALYGGVPSTSAYSGVGPGGWNESSMTNWLTFLEKDFGKMPKDSNNSYNVATYANVSGARVYHYYCYPASTTGGWPDAPTVRLGYHKEDDSYILRQFTVQSCLSSLPT